MRKHTSWLATILVALAPVLAVIPAPIAGQNDPVVQKIIELGTTDNQVMSWADYASNRFGGRITGSDAYTNATAWAEWQFQQWGVEVELDEVGEIPVGFNRGPWFGKVVAPFERSLYFGTPSFTAGTKGAQRGPVVILETDPFSIPSRNPSPEDVEAKRAAVAEAIAEVKADPGVFHGAWVLIAGDNSGFGRDGRRSTPEYSDSELMPPLTKTLVEAGALGTIQRAGLPLRILDGHVDSWDQLPNLPDIKLLDTQYDEIHALVEEGEVVELEFDIRNWFKMGPVKYYNIVGVIPGSTYPDEYVILGGHFDSFDGGTGGVDDGSGFSPGMEALRLIQEAGGTPKRSIVMILFAAEEIGLVGSQAWLADHPELHDDIVVMINRDGSPSAITGAVVPPGWYDDFQKITAPLAELNPRWPFTVEENPYPGQETDYSYMRAWHTLYDLYSELVPYTEHQEHSALVTAVVAYGIANLDQPLTRDGVYLPDGLFADIITASGARVITSLDYENAPLQVANFIRIVEGNAGPPSGRFGGPRGATAVGRIIEPGGGMVNAVVESAIQESMMEADLPLTSNPAVKHDGPGVFGVSGPNTFYLTQGADPALDGRFTALGRVVAGLEKVAEMAAGDEIRRIRILRSGQAALDFATDDASFQRLLAGGGVR